jgi:hypothetical protein
MPDYLDYQKSIAAEFKAFEKRVRNLIDKSHWGEEGHFKEVVLMNYLKRILPKHLSVGTGFVRNDDKITKQIDIIIYDNTFPVLFSEGDFVITTSRNVIGIIEVKSSIEPYDLCDIIEKANNNAEIIVGESDMNLFNGIFSYNYKSEPKKYVDKLNEHDFSNLVRKQPSIEIVSRKLSSCVNHIALGDKYFIKLWPLGQDEENKERFLSENPANYAPYYSLYNMDYGLAFSYFLSNLQEFIIRVATSNFDKELPKEMKGFLYPIEEGKEICIFDRIYLDKDINEELTKTS